MSTARSPMRLIVRSDHDHPQAPLAELGLGHHIDTRRSTKRRLARSISPSSSTRLRFGEVLRERVEGDADHLLRRVPHLDQHVDERGSGSAWLRASRASRSSRNRPRCARAAGADVEASRAGDAGRARPASVARAGTGSSPRSQGRAGRSRRRTRSPRRPVRRPSPGAPGWPSDGRDDALALLLKLRLTRSRASSIAIPTRYDPRNALALRVSTTPSPPEQARIPPLPCGSYLGREPRGGEKHMPKSGNFDSHHWPSPRSPR